MKFKAGQQKFRPYYFPARILLASLAVFSFSQSGCGTAGDALSKAQALDRNSDYKNALVEYDRVLSLDASNRVAMRGRAHCLVGLNQNKKALKIYDYLLQRDHDPGLVSERAVALYGGRDLNQALAGWTAALKTLPHRPNPLKWRAVVYMEQGEFKKALADLDEYVNCCPDSWTARSCRAVARAAAGDFSGSLADLSRYLYIKRNVSFHIRYSAERADLEDKAHPGPFAPPEMQLNAEQAKLLRAAIVRKLGGDTSAGLRTQALLSFFEHDYRRALSELSKVKATGVDAANLLALRSICHRAVAANDEAIKEAEQAIAIMPARRIYYEILDGAYFAAGRREDSLKALKLFATRRPNDAGIMLTQADVNSQLGERDEARAILARLLAVKPDCVDALIMRADLYKADLQNAKAIEDFSRAKELDPKNGKAIEGLGFACYEMGQVDKAAENFEIVAALGYDLKRVYVARALCLDKKGKAAMAAKLRAESVDLAL